MFWESCINFSLNIWIEQQKIEPRDVFFNIFSNMVEIEAQSDTSNVSNALTMMNEFQSSCF